MQTGFFINRCWRKSCLIVYAHQEWWKAGSPICFMAGTSSTPTKCRQQTMSGEGTLIVECEDPDVQVEVKGDVVKLLQGEKRYEIRLKPGRFSVTIKGGKENLKLDTDEFVLEKAGKRTVRIRYEPLAAQSKKGSEIAGKPIPVTPTSEPLGPLALVGRPAKLPGVRSWTIETTGHRGAINAATCSPDGKWLASGGLDGTIRIWNVQEAWKLEKVFLVEPILFLVWSPDSSKLACHGTEKAFVYDVASSRRLFEVDARGGRPSWSPDSERVIFQWDDNVRIFRASNGQLIQEGGLGVSLGFLSEGKILATLSPGSKIRLWNADTLKLVREFLLPKESHSDDLRRFILAWSPDGKRVALAQDKFLWIIDGESGKILRTNNQSSIENSRRAEIAWSPNGKKIALALVANVTWHLEILDADSGKTEYTTASSRQGFSPPSWTQDSKYVVGASRNDDASWLYRGTARPDRNTASSAVRIYEVGGATIPYRILHAASPWADINWLSWLPDGKTLMASGGGIWHADIGKNLPDEERDNYGNYGISPDGKLQVRFGNHGLSFHTLAPDKLISDSGNVKIAGLPPISWSRDSKLLLTGEEDGRIRFWDPLTAKERKTIHLYKRPPALSLSPDGKSLAVGQLGPIFVHDLDSLALKKQLNGHTVSYSPRGKYLAGYDENQVHVWTTTNYETVNKFGPITPTRHANAVIAWSPDETTLAVGLSSHGNGKLSLWDPITGQLRATLLPLREGGGLAVSAAGHYRGPVDDMSQQLVYVVQTENGQETLRQAEFEKRYGWKNDPQQVQPMGRAGQGK